MKKTHDPKKKLALATHTVRSLEPSELDKIFGGKTTAITCTCPRTTNCTGALCG